MEKNSVCKEVVVKKEKKQKCAKYGIMDTFLNNKKMHFYHMQ